MVQSQGSPRVASAVAFLFWTGWQAIVPFMALYATALGARPAAVGAILGGYSILALFLSLPAGIMAERVGSGRMMFAGCLLGAVSLLMIALGGSLTALAIGLTILGIAQIMVSIGTQVETILGSAQRNLARVMALYFFFSSTSQVVGPAIGALLVHGTNYRAAVFGAAGLNVLAMIAAGGAARRTPVRDAMVARPPAFETIISTLGRKPAARAALLVSLVAELAMAFWSTFFPLLLTRRGYGSEAIAFFFALRAISNTGVRPLISRITARLPRTQALTFSLLMTGLALAAMPLVTSRIALGAAVLVFGFAGGIYVTLSAIAVAAGFQAEAAGVGVGMRVLMSRIGLIVGPILMGLVVESLGYLGAFVVGAAICGGTALLYLPRPRPSAMRAARSRGDTVRH